MSLQDVAALPDRAVPRPVARRPLALDADPAAAITTRAKASAHDLLTMLLGLRTRVRAAAAPRVNVRISVYTPNGQPAVAIRLGSGKRANNQ